MGHLGAGAYPGAPGWPIISGPMPILHQRRTYQQAAKRDLGVPGELECQIITDFEKLEELAGVWDELWRSDPRAEVFQNFTWARVWWQCFGEQCKLCALVVYEVGQVVLILPLVERAGVLQFLGFPQGDYFDLLCRHSRPSQLLEMALRFLLRLAPGWKECLLGPLRPDSEMVDAAGRLPDDLRDLIRLHTHKSCPTILFGENRSEVIKQLLNGKHARRRLQNLAKAGVVRFRHIEDKQEAQRHLTDFFRCHRRRCAVFTRTSCFENPQMCKMVRALVEALDLRRELRFGVLELDGRPLAWSLGFEANGKYSYYQQTFDMDAEEYAPGDVLLHHLLGYAKGNVDREFDFLRGDQFFKRRFATHIRQTQMLSFRRPGLLGVLRQMHRSIHAQLRDISRGAQALVQTHVYLFRTSRSICTGRRNLMRRLRRAKQAGALTEYLLLAGWDRLRRAIWSRRHATLFAMKGSRAVSARPESLPNPNIDVATGYLNDLIDLAVEHPEISLPEFNECRSRLKHGDRVYLVRENGKIALVVWAGVRPINESSKSAESPAKAGTPAITVYECWPIKNPEAGCASLLERLGREASESKANVVVYCPALPLKSQLALEGQGFVPKSRIVSSTILHWLRRDSTLPCRSAAEQPRSDCACPNLKKRPTT